MGSSRISYCNITDVCGKCIYDSIIYNSQSQKETRYSYQGNSRLNYEEATGCNMMNPSKSCFSNNFNDMRNDYKIVVSEK